MLSSLSSTIMTVFAIPFLLAAQRRRQLGHDGKRLVAIPYGKANAGHHAALADKTATKRFTRPIELLRACGTRSRCPRGVCPPCGLPLPAGTPCPHSADSSALPSAERW